MEIGGGKVMQKTYAEDYKSGEVFNLGTYEVTAEEISTSLFSTRMPLGE